MRAYILTISDRSYRKEREDITGPKLIEAVRSVSFSVSGYSIIPDDKEAIRKTIEDLADNDKADLILTAGGTGFAKRDVTPEATAEAAERFVPGIAEAIRADSLKKTRKAMLSRGIAAIRKEALIINLPGSPGGAVESFLSVSDTLEHGIALLKGEKPDG